MVFQFPILLYRSITITGILESSEYFSDRRLTKSIACPCILAVAVYKCLLNSGLNLVTPKLDIFYYLFYEYAFICLTNYSPFILSNAISMSCDYLFINLLWNVIIKNNIKYDK
jgi:hypothetical protein